MLPTYPAWLKEQKYADNTQVAQLHRVKKVEEAYGNLDTHFANGTYDDVIASLQYSVEDERAKKPNPSKMKFDGNIRNNLQSYKNSVVRYRKFLKGEKFEVGGRHPSEGEIDIDETQQDISEQRQKLSLERDMQAALRLNIAALGQNLRIVDDGAERSVTSGLIDITCEDNHGLVVIELKAGKADSKAIGQILGYMGDLAEEEERPVRGILIAHEFDQRVKSASRVVSTLELKRYSVEFKFTAE